MHIRVSARTKKELWAGPGPLPVLGAHATVQISGERGSHGIAHKIPKWKLDGPDGRLSSRVFEPLQHPDSHVSGHLSRLRFRGVSGHIGIL